MKNSALLILGFLLSTYSAFANDKEYDSNAPIPSLNFESYFVGSKVEKINETSSIQNEVNDSLITDSLQTQNVKFEFSDADNKTFKKQKRIVGTVIVIVGGIQVAGILIIRSLLKSVNKITFKRVS